MRRSYACVAMFMLGAMLLSGCGLLRSNRAPAAIFEVAPEGGYCPAEIVFDASGSSDPDGDRLIYAWSFGDGAQGWGTQAVHTYEVPGTYQVVLRVTDPKGLDDADIHELTVLAVPEGSVLLRFAWTWEDAPQRLDFPAPWGLYQTYRGQLRIPLVDNYDYGAFVEDSRDDPTLGDLADLLWARVDAQKLEYAAYALGFVQGGITYAADASNVEWPLYPLETLVDGKGDCEDTAILYVSLLKARGIPCKLAFVDTNGDAFPDHVLALVGLEDEAIPQPGAKAFELDGTTYVVAETASGAMALGMDPWELEPADLVQLWSF